MENNSTERTIEKLTAQLANKNEQLNQLFELSSEFSGILELDILTKLLIFTIESNFFIENFALIYFDDKTKRILETNITNNDVKDLISKTVNHEIENTVFTENNFPELFEMGIKLLIPLKIKSQTRGIILLGDKKSKENYTDHDIEFIMSVGNLGMISIENAILFQETLEKQKIERDLETARAIQKNLLPQNIIQPDNIQISAYSESANMVGGDFYDIIENDKAELFIAIGDVSGKGISASLLVANSMAYLRSICKQNFSLSEATGLLNNLVYENTFDNVFITFFWGLLNPTDYSFTYINAGHNPPYLIRDNEMVKLEEGGLLLGMMQTTAPYSSGTITLKKNDYLVLFTDGVTEAMNKNEEEYGDDRMEELCKSFSIESAEDVKNKILDDISLFTENIAQSDDLTFVILKVN